MMLRCLSCVAPRAAVRSAAAADAARLLCTSQQPASLKDFKQIAQNTKFMLSELDALVVQFRRRQQGDDDKGYLNRTEFSRYMTSSALHLCADGLSEQSLDHYFRAFDTDGDGRVDFKELATGLSTLTRGGIRERAEFLFKLWDDSGDGLLQLDEFQRMAQVSLAGTSGRSEAALARRAEQSFARLDSDHDGALTLDEFLKLYNLYPELHSQLPATSRANLSPEELAVFELVGSSFALRQGTRLCHLADSPAVYLLVEGEVGVTLPGTDLKMLEVAASSEHPFLGEAVLFTADRSLYGDAAVSSPDGARFMAIKLADLMPLVLQNHRGASQLMQRFGALMYARLGEIDARLSAHADGPQGDAVRMFLDFKKMLVSQWALRYHTIGKTGKIETVPTKSVGTAADLSVAYSPGVAEPCLAIKDNPDMSYEYTSRGHLVGVVSNGTAVLGLGNIGALASKPVMEGKAVLFKKFGMLDSFDIEADQPDPEKFIELCVAISATFGGINIEDVKSPECFYIEREVQRRCSIPIMHDDQHGTAIIAGAGLLNALLLAGKSIEDIRVVVSGCGAAGFTCAKYLVSLGVRRENLIACDINGTVHVGREDLVAQPSYYLNEIAIDTPRHTLQEAVEGADCFLGLSVGGLLKPAMLATMNHDPLVFACANPYPEIDYALAKKTRKDAIVGTGRSDFPNQINNVLAFPYIFRGALDCRAKAINEDMKVAATKAIAELARSDSHFGREYIIPKPFDPRLLSVVSSAVAGAAMATNVARLRFDIDAYAARLEEDAKMRT